MKIPYISGHELISHLRNEDFSDLPVLVISGLDPEEGRVAAEKMGANDFLAKPIDPDVLIEKVQHLVFNT